jgi:NAD(P)-dependent dehydrogenase (short-subunit alcohol dehydrogenase family)
MKNLKNKNIVVTGGAEGLGKSLVLFLLEAGANVVVYDLKAPDYLNEFNENSARLSYYQGDVTKKKEVKEFVKFFSREHHKLDILINNAGISIARNKADKTPDKLSEFIFNVNYWGAVYFTKYFLPLMPVHSASKIVNVCSIYSLFSVRERAAYCASKSALNAYSKALRLELKPKNIGVICVFPGRVDTKITMNSRGWASEAEKIRAVRAQNTKNALSPESAAFQIIRGIMKCKKNVYVGFDAKMARLLLRFSPVKGEIFINKLIRRAEIKTKQRILTPALVKKPSDLGIY